MVEFCRVYGRSHRHGKEVTLVLRGKCRAYDYVILCMN